VRTHRRRLLDLEQSLDWLTRQLYASSPVKRVERQRERLVELARRLKSGVRQTQVEYRQSLANLRYRLRQRSPELRVQKVSAALESLHKRLAQHMLDVISDKQHRLALSARALNSVSPLATLKRGYAIVLDDSGKALTDVATLSTGDVIHGRLSRGRFTATVDSIDTED
jgi:exodeoxyribonuclease VII large subunit